MGGLSNQLRSGKMKNCHVPLRSLLIATFVGMLIAVAPQIACAQTCPGSSLSYIVRDSKGATIQAAWPDDLRFEGEAVSSNGTHSRWNDGGISVPTSMTTKAPADIVKLQGKVTTLNTGPMFTFSEPAKLRLTWGGKVMSLLFVMPTLGKYASKHFIVDSLPFQEGRYEISLSLSSESPFDNYFPAVGWQKVTEAEEAFDEGSG